VFFCAPAIFSPSVLTRIKITSKYLFARRPDIPVVFTADDVFMARGPKQITSTWRLVHDPLPLTSTQMAQLLSAPPPREDKPVEFLVFGSLAAHKGIYEILNAAALLPPEIAARVRLRFLGLPATDERDDLVATLLEAQRKAKVEIVFNDMFATEDQLIEALSHCDVMLATRRHHEGVSNNLIWAAAAGRPTISQNSGWMAHVTNERRLGTVCDPLDPNAIAQAIINACTPGWRETVFDTGAARAFAANYTAGNFYEAIVRELSQRCSSVAVPASQEAGEAARSTA
jgi:glycosyltransferase involved in cell wall biosynthesis